MSEELLFLIITHLVSDWLFQPAKWAVKKIKIFKYRFLHSLQYILLFIPVLYLLNISLFWLIWIFATHLFIDSYKFVNFWNNKIRSRGLETPRGIIIVQDQILHLVVLIPVVLKVSWGII
jgi:hypothetical protein